MKKTYMKPSTEVIIMEVERIIASSGGHGIFFDDDNSFGYLDDDYAEGDAM